MALHYFGMKFGTPGETPNSIQFLSYHWMCCQMMQEVDAEWAARLEETQAAAAAAKDSVRRELDAQIEAITRRLNELSSAEARRERRRTELSEEVPFYHSILNHFEQYWGTHCHGKSLQLTWQSMDQDRMFGLSTVLS